MRTASRGGSWPSRQEAPDVAVRGRVDVDGEDAAPSASAVQTRIGFIALSWLRVNHLQRERADA
jgi:hypothetical protein